jgi:biotin-[acetyl-CoA-carboxylase] ligase BirA-like protein
VRGPEFGHGFRLLDLATVGSTNDVARNLAEAGEPAGLFVRAERQTAGRGRHGRSWQSPPGNLYASLLLRPTRPPAEVASLSLVAALALAEAIERVSNGRIAPRLKWPNDLQVKAAKLAGILLEMSADGRGGCAWLIMGIGVNLGALERSALSRYLSGRARLQRHAAAAAGGSGRDPAAAPRSLGAGGLRWPSRRLAGPRRRPRLAGCTTHR